MAALQPRRLVKPTVPRPERKRSLLALDPFVDDKSIKRVWSEEFRVWVRRKPSHPPPNNPKRFQFDAEFCIMSLQRG